MEMRLLSREELQKLLIQAQAEGYYEVFLLELTTGLRVGELMALQWDDLVSLLSGMPPSLGDVQADIILIASPRVWKPLPKN